jgi:hypothetical protein
MSWKSSPVRTATGPAIPAPSTEHAEGFHRSAAQGSNAKKLPDEQAKHAMESPPILGQSHQGAERTVQTEVDDQKRRADFDGRCQQAVVDLPPDLPNLGRADQEGERRPLSKVM